MRKSILVFLATVAIASAAQTKSVAKPVPVPTTPVAAADLDNSLKANLLTLKLLRAKTTWQSAIDKQKQNALNWYAAEAKAKQAEKEADEAAPALQQTTNDAQKAFQEVIDEAYRTKGYTKEKYDFDLDKLDFVEKKVEGKK